MGGATEVTSRVPLQASRLAAKGDLAALPIRACDVGHASHLLFKSPMGRLAFGIGGGLCGVRNLGALVVAPAAHVRGFHRVVSWRRRVVDLHCSLARSSVAAGSRGDAAGGDRRRHCAPHRSPQL